jgi:hypothetical protein
MRELLDLATRKGVDKAIAQMRAAGFIPDIRAQPSDAEKYEEELKKE